MATLTASSAQIVRVPLPGTGLDRERRAEVSSEADVQKLLSFFPEAGGHCQSNRVGLWAAATVIRFQCRGGELVEIGVDDEFRSWTEGFGDWPVRPGLRAFIDSISAWTDVLTEKESVNERAIRWLPRGAVLVCVNVAGAVAFAAAAIDVEGGPPMGRSGALGYISLYLVGLVVLACSVLWGLWLWLRPRSRPDLLVAAWGAIVLHAMCIQFMMQAVSHQITSTPGG